MGNKSEIIEVEICVEILKKNVYKNIKYFDLVLLIPSFVFLLFLIYQCRNMMKSLISQSSSIINTFFILLCLACSLKVVRSVIAMILDPINSKIQTIDKTLWLIVRFFLLATEMSIITFGVAAARLDTRNGIKRVLIVTSLISLTYTATQASLEFASPDRRFKSLYGHGGALFFFVSSLFFFIIYCVILILPSIGCDRQLKLPTKKIFYLYCGILALLYLIESIGSILFYINVSYGLCLIDFTTLIYFIGYDPLVYATFLHNYVRNRNTLTTKYNPNIIEYPETSEDFNKTYSYFTTSASQNNLDPHNHSVNNQHSKSLDDNWEQHRVDNDNYFSPDNLVIIDRDNADVVNINQIMKNYHIMSEGAQLEYATRYSSNAAYENQSSDEHNKSIILSLSEEREPTRRQTWDMDDFANK